MAMAEIERHKGTQFHPVAAEAVLKIFRESPEKLTSIIIDEL